MQRWEFAHMNWVASVAATDTHVRFTHGAEWADEADAWAVLRRLGDEGWELVGHTVHEPDGIGPGISTQGFWFKRPRHAD